MIIVAVVKTNHLIEIEGKPSLIDLKWAPGQVGVIPVFDTEENAKAYAGEGIETIEIEEQIIYPTDVGVEG